MIIFPINTIITIVDIAFIALVIVLIMMYRQIQEQEATLKVLHKEQAGVKVVFPQKLLQRFASSFLRIEFWRFWGIFEIVSRIRAVFYNALFTIFATLMFKRKWGVSTAF